MFYRITLKFSPRPTYLKYFCDFLSTIKNLSQYYSILGNYKMQSKSEWPDLLTQQAILLHDNFSPNVTFMKCRQSERYSVGESVGIPNVQSILVTL